MRKKMPIFDLNKHPIDGYEKDMRKILGKNCHL